MKIALRNGVIAVLLYLVVINITYLLQVGDLNRLLDWYQTWESRRLISEIATWVGIFVVGLIHGSIKAPRSLLVVGFCFMYFFRWLIAIAYMDVPSPVFVYWLFPICGTGIAFVPILLFWLIKRYKKQKK